MCVCVVIFIHLSFYLFQGKTSSEKVKEVREKLKEKKASTLVLTQLDEIACKYE